MFRRILPLIFLALAALAPMAEAQLNPSVAIGVTSVIVNERVHLGGEAALNVDVPVLPLTATAYASLVTAPSANAEDSKLNAGLEGKLYFTDFRPHTRLNAGVGYQFGDYEGYYGVAGFETYAGTVFTVRANDEFVGLTLGRKILRY